MSAVIVQPSTTELFNQAVDLHMTCHYAAAISLYEQVLARESPRADALNNLGLCLTLTGKAEEGTEMIRTAISLCPDDPDYWSSLGFALVRENKTDAAHYVLAHALYLNPHHAESTELLKGLEPYHIPPDTPTTQAIPTSTSILPAAASVSVITTSRPNSGKSKSLWIGVALYFLGTAMLAGLYIHFNNSRPSTNPRLGQKLAFVISQVSPYSPQSMDAMVSNSFVAPAEMISADTTVHPQGYLCINAINKYSEMVGVYLVGNHVNAFTRRNNVTDDLGALPGDADSSALSVNSLGNVVGWSGTATHRAVLWYHGQAYDLNNLIPNSAGLRLTDGLMIDDTNSVVALAQDASSQPMLVRITLRN
jgi:hypothetical protein